MMGAIFVIAETGTFAVCTNEGNADLSANVPKLQIASIGVEKIISRLEHLAVFIRLLSRSALGPPITQYNLSVVLAPPHRELFPGGQAAVASSLTLQPLKCGKG
jgi:L-lactate utilization protein LutB